MANDYTTLFSYLKTPEPPRELLQKILQRIQQRERRMFWERCTFFSVVAIGCFSALLPVFRAVQTDVGQSGIWQFLSLLFSDPDVVVRLGGDFLLLVLESVPAVSIAALFALAFALFFSLILLARDILAALFSHQRKHSYE